MGNPTTRAANWRGRSHSIVPDAISAGYEQEKHLSFRGCRIYGMSHGDSECKMYRPTFHRMLNLFALRMAHPLHLCGMADLGCATNGKSVLLPFTVGIIPGETTHLPQIISASQVTFIVSVLGGLMFPDMCIRCKLPVLRGRYMQGHNPALRGYLMSAPLDRLIDSLSQTGMTRFFRRLFEDFPDLLMKDMTVDGVKADRTINVNGRWVRNFGSDSFLGLDQHPAVIEAIERGVREWGSHNGTSRAFSSVAPNIEVEEKIAAWMGTEAALLFPSVTLANTGAIPGLVTRHDVIVADQFAHNSIEDGTRLAKARGVRTAKFAHNSAEELERMLRELRPFRHSLIAVDGVYSMSGQLPPLAEFQKVARTLDGFLYVDDAHGTGVLGVQGRGTVRDALGGYDNTLVIGSLSKALSCLGGFVAGSQAAIDVLKLRSNPLIFGGPVPPPYLVAASAALDVVASPEYDRLRSTLDANVRRFVDGANKLGLAVLGGLVPIVSVLVGAEDATLQAGRFLFDRGYYVQSVVFPAVPHGAGVLRVQINANHPPDAIDGLIGVLGELKQVIPLPGPDGEVIRLPVSPSVRPEAIPA